MCNSSFHSQATNQTKRYTSVLRLIGILISKYQLTLPHMPLKYITGK